MNLWHQLGPNSLSLIKTKHNHQHQNGIYKGESTLCFMVSLNKFTSYSSMKFKKKEYGQAVRCYQASKVCMQCLHRLAVLVILNKKQKKTGRPRANTD